MEKIIREGLEAMGIPATPEQVLAMAAYGELLLRANETTNLTAIRDPAAAARLHFLDSAALLTVADFSGDKSVADVGSGAGFPGVPLRILRPRIRLTCLDSVGKKMDFVRESCAALGMEDVRCLWGRAEEMAELRESFDIVTSRAVAELHLLAELCLPLAKVGGLFLAMKNPDCDEETVRGAFAINALGGRVREVRRYEIAGADVTHAVVVIEKIKPTPPQYPRRWAQIKKRPLLG